MNQETVGRYQIVRKLGDGGMGAVYLAHDPRFPRDVALKILHPQFSQDPNFRQRFEREARTIAALEHHAIVPVHDFGEHQGRPYLVMRLMTGGTLVDWRHGDHLSVDEITPIVDRIASALDRAHELDIVHRDLKPANVLFDDRANAYLSDFGIVKLLTGHTLTAEQALIGTPTYMSPEQAQGNKEIDGRSDIYSLGVVVFELLNGRPPYRADTGIAVALKHITEPVPSLRETRPDLASGVCRVVEQALAKDPGMRFPTAGAFARALSTAAAGTPAVQAQTIVEPTPQETVVSASTSSPSADRRFPRPLLFGIGGVAGLIFVAALLVGAMALLNRAGGDAQAQATITVTATRAVATATTGAAAGSEAELAVASLDEPAEEPTATLTPAPTETGTPTPSPTPAFSAGDTMIAESDGKVMVYVPAGDFLQGSIPADPEARDVEMPQRTVTLDAFWIDRTETTTAQYRQCVQAGACPPPQDRSSRQHSSYFGNAEFSQHPVIWVNWNMADAYCRWTERRLPTEAEWEKAARGTDGRLFPWGNQLPGSSMANICDANCPYEWADRSLNDGYWDTAPVESFQAGASPYGALNMAGNVWEWVSDFYDPNYYQYAPQDNPPGPETAGSHVLRGGSWQNTWAFIRTTTRDRETRFPENLYNVGFRCAQSAP
ncbi:MAG: bifunctional serine/threonine-protein kinase/formylglycine-generating enzyme family protein [Candidatus Promineifilaceae bacterium]|nr:bifunctional serine/threonine-protein kinase/formylglycine-generating enzyme family protein [Candidatus Promineifilaceae bacterium]